jgi:hypothetical protein
MNPGPRSGPPSGVSRRGIFTSGIVTPTALGCAALGLAALFWWPLFRGGGFIGGDVYSYYLPQKVVYAEDLASRRLPLWNDRAGHGYPIVGESQTGPFYPFNALLYGVLPINAAYNVNHLLHYLLTFVFTWMYARSVRLSGWAAGLAALVYTYGWFPPRCSLEWAIIGGAWLPAALWCVEKFLATRCLRFAFGLSGILALQLLAGHFNLAFLTELTLVAYVPLRLFFARGDLPAATQLRSRRMASVWLAAVACAFGLSAVQMAPTWELKELSQRESPGQEHKLAQGSIPFWYLSQMIEPWHWYALDTDRNAALRESESQLGAPTNQIEAHLYFGLIPLMLALSEVIPVFRGRDRIGLIWLILSIAALLYTTGWFLGLTRHVPGFDFFQGPGRYGLITTLGVGMLAGKSLDRLRGGGSLLAGLALLVALGATMWTGMSLTAQGLLAEKNGFSNPFHVGAFVLSDAFLSNLLLVGLVAVIVALVVQRLNRGSPTSQATRLAGLALTIAVLVTTSLDLWLVSRVVKDSQMVSDPPINYLGQSPIQRILSARKGVARVYEPNGLGNLLTVFDAGKTPVYLTFGPAAYVDPKLTMPTSAGPKQIDWLRGAGVTHVLSTTPLNEAEWPVRHVWTGFDPVLNPPLARYHDPLYLYELLGSRGRVAWEKPGPQSAANVTEQRPSQVVIEANSDSGGRLVLTDLMYPGWGVTVDGAAAQAQTFEGMYRAVDVAAGRHTVVWSYRPRSVYWGLAISAITFLFLATVAHVRYWHPQRLDFLDPAERQ